MAAITKEAVAETENNYTVAGTKIQHYNGFPKLFQNPITTYRQVSAMMTLGTSVSLAPQPVPNLRCSKLTGHARYRWKRKCANYATLVRLI